MVIAEPRLKADVRVYSNLHEIRNERMMAIHRRQVQGVEALLRRSKRWRSLSVVISVNYCAKCMGGGCRVGRGTVGEGDGADTISSTHRHAGFRVRRRLQSFQTLQRTNRPRQKPRSHISLQRHPTRWLSQDTSGFKHNREDCLRIIGGGGALTSSLECTSEATAGSRRRALTVSAPPLTARCRIVCLATCDDGEKVARRGHTRA